MEIQLTAREMFEKLGYKQEYHIAYIKYYNEDDDLYIWFNQEDETIDIRFDFGVDILQAINKQVEELRW